MWFITPGVREVCSLRQQKPIRWTILVLSCGTANSDEIIPIEFDIVDGRTIRAGMNESNSHAAIGDQESPETR
jgi:hypothetical protein